MPLISLLDHDGLTLAADPVTGAVTSLTLYGRELLDATAPGSEVHVNDLPLDLKAAGDRYLDMADYPRCITGTGPNQMHGVRLTGHYTGWGLDVTRAQRAAGRNRVDLCWTVQRSKVRTLGHCPGPGWGCIEAPLQMDRLAVGTWNWRFWGDDTRMLAYNGGNSGPREHLSFENGPVAEVKRWVDHTFRRQYAGTMSLPGVIFHDVASGHWIALLCRRAQVSYELDHRHAGLGTAFAFLPNGSWAMHQSQALPTISLHWGKDAASREAFLAEQLSRFYEEPAEWFGKTTWFEFVSGPELFRDWKEMHRAALALTEGGGVNGLWLTPHRRNLAWGGTSPDGLGPMPDLGPVADFEVMVKDLKQRGVRLATWFSTCGMTPSGEADPDWFIKGIDGDTLPVWGIPSHPDIVAVNLNHPGYQSEIAQRLNYYLGELGMDAAIFDCAGFSYPHDWAQRPWQRYPSDTTLGTVRFFEHVRKTVRAIGPDKMIINEGGGLDCFNNVLLKTGNNVGPDGRGCRDVLIQARQHGGKRFYMRGGHEADLAAGMVMIEPHGNFGFVPGESASMTNEAYAKIGSDPFNRALTKLVADVGVHAAEPLPCGGGVSILGEVLAVPQPRADTISPAALVPSFRGAEKVDGIRIVLPRKATALTDLVSGERILPAVDGSFTITRRGLFRIGA